MYLISRIESKLGSSDGQMTVELCVVFPVLIIVAVIAMNALAFFSDCAEFDRVSRNAIRLNASSVRIDHTTDESISSIVDAVEGELGEAARGRVECVAEGRIDHGGWTSDADDFTTYTVTYSFCPTLFGMALRHDVFGVELPSIKHSISLTVNTYSSGKYLWSYLL